MASLYARKNVDGTLSWRVQFRRKGRVNLSATFATEEEARKFIEEREADHCFGEHDSLILQRIAEFIRKGKPL